MTGAGRDRLTRRVLPDVWRAEARLIAPIVALRLCAAVLTPLDAVALGLLVDAGLRRDGAAALLWAAALAFCDVAASALNHPAGKLELTLRERTDLLFEERLLRLSTAPGTLEHLERPEYHDRITLARDRSSSLGDLLVQALALLQALVLLGVVFAALASVSWPLVGLIATALLTVVCAGRAEVVRARCLERLAGTYRLTDRLFDIGTAAASVKEIKVNGAEDGLRQRLSAEHRGIVQAVSGSEVRAVGIAVAGWLVFSAAYTGALAFVIHETVHGRVSIGQLLLVLALALRLNEHVGDVAEAFGGIRRTTVAVRRLAWLYDNAPPPGTDTEPAQSDEPDQPDVLAGGDAVELRDVTFRYPGTDADVLRGLSLRLDPGTTVAVVGDNGAGKTTLVKLLAGLYRPTSGQILSGGRNLNGLDELQWRRSLSASFQDFVRFELLVREAVGVGAIERLDDLAEIWRAIDSGGARPAVEALPAGADTQLGRAWPDGVELSLGQWQKVAMSRALMRRRPALLILDEPTASLDTAAEHALFDRFRRTSDLAAIGGAITLLISHRFATVRMADVIVLLRDGRAVEVGSHDELMALGGIYAELFDLQAKGYR